MENESKLNMLASFTVRAGRDEIKSCFGIASDASKALMSMVVVKPTFAAHDD